MYVIQNAKLVPLMYYMAASGEIEKVYNSRAASWLDGILWLGNVTTMPNDAPRCGWHNELCEDNSTDSTVRDSLLVVLVVVLVVILLAIVYIMLGKRKHAMNLKQLELVQIKWGNMKIKTATRSELGEHYNNLCHDANIYEYTNMTVFVKTLDSGNIDLKDKHVFTDIIHMKGLNHENINGFIGVCVEAPNVCIVMAYAPRGSIMDIIESQDVQFDLNFKSAILLDVAHGMWYLHHSPIKAHGRLTSSKCVFDTKWICKITAYGSECLRNEPLISYKNTSSISHHPSKLLWTAPEFLIGATKAKHRDKQMGDIYSFGIIMQEIVLESRPFGDDNITSAEAILERVWGQETPPFRPKVDDRHGELKYMMQMCWQENPEERPSFSKILKKVNLIRKKKGLEISLVDSMIQRLEVHTSQLEDRVTERAQELNEEKAKVQTILFELLPHSVAKQLSTGGRVEPEIFNCITIFFSDLVGFTSIAANFTAMEIVIILNQLYTAFDNILHKYDVYKVATIGDSYMVSSGCPIRNGIKHAAEICKMALGLLDVIKEFPTLNTDQNRYLHMRSGIHSGPCVAGLAGIKMPRYLLFGDTVDIASRMESGGKAMEIHVSESTEYLVRESAELKLETRGVFYMKGKPITTYWLYSQ